MSKFLMSKFLRTPKVYVAMSGGVDSSVVAALLKDDGYDVTGVYFKTYKPDGNREYCKQQGTDARQVCEQLSIPFKVFDLQDEYKKFVFDYMLHEYKAGHTPNPDIMCNKHIKFGVFLQKALQDGADAIATGHYAQIKRSATLPLSIFSGNVTKCKLYKSVDESKDQTYFLSQLSQEQLSRTIFRIGKFKKSEVRNIAEKYRLHTAHKKDSQGICFIGKEINVKKFLKFYIPEQEGDVLNINGEKVGTHDGAIFYTIGERHNFKINPSYQSPNMPRLFVLSRNIEKNTITIGTKEELHSLSKSSILLSDLNWINMPPKPTKKYKCRIRHRGALYTCSTQNIQNSENILLNFKDPPHAPAVGQFVAIYNKRECLGGGVISSC